MARDFYSVLSLTPEASPQQIRARFLELARSRHPDLFSGEEKERAEEQFQSITEAFNVLSHPERRRKHDIEVIRPEPQRADPEFAARQFSQRGQRAFREGRFAEAVMEFERAVQVEDGSAQHWYGLALAASKDTRYLSRGIQAASKACELDTMNGSYYKLAGKIFVQAGMLVRAERYYRLALQWLGSDEESEAALSRLEKQRPDR